MDEIKKIIEDYEITSPYPSIQEAQKDLKKRGVTIISDEGTSYYAVIIKDQTSNDIDALLVNTSPTYKVTKDGVETWYEGGNINDEIRDLLPFLKKYLQNIWVEELSNSIIDQYYPLFYEEILSLIESLSETKENKCSFIKELENFFIKNNLPAGQYDKELNEITENFFFKRLTPKKEREILSDIIDYLSDKFSCEE